MPVPANLSFDRTEHDVFHAVCWKDDFPNATCKEIPDLDPPAVEGICEDTHAVALRLPAGACIRVTGNIRPVVMTSSGCVGTGHQAGSCVEQHNTADEEITVYVHPLTPTSWSASWRIIGSTTGPCFSCL
jgi:hypothetical protein